MSKPLKLLVGVLSIWPILYILLLFALVASSFVWMSRTDAAQTGPSAGPPAVFAVLFAGHLATILVILGLFAFYIVYLFKTDRVPPEKKGLWAAMLFLGTMIAMPVFFYLYVWPDEWPRSSRGRPAR